MPSRRLQIRSSAIVLFFSFSEFRIYVLFELLRGM
ncbi:hypothetical protein X975_26626, partial [Stegodyphus mimosarum]